MNSIESNVGYSPRLIWVLKANKMEEMIWGLFASILHKTTTDVADIDKYLQITS